MRGGSAESRRGIRSILKVDENPAARSKILMERPFLQKDRKIGKKWKNVKKLVWAAMARQSIENKAFGEGARRPPMHRTRFLDQNW